MIETTIAMIAASSAALAIILLIRAWFALRFAEAEAASAMALAAMLMVGVSVVQIRREMGDSIPSNSTVRNLFDTDQRFAPGSGDDHSLRAPAVVQPVNYANY